MFCKELSQLHVQELCLRKLYRLHKLGIFCIHVFVEFLLNVWRQLYLLDGYYSMNLDMSSVDIVKYQKSNSFLFTHNVNV